MCPRDPRVHAGSCCGQLSRARRSATRAPRDPDELVARVVERLVLEPAVERFDLEPGDFDGALPLRPRRPPERDPRAGVELQDHVGQVEHHTGGAMDERGRLVQRHVPHVLLPQLQVDTCAGGTLSRDLEHRRRRVDPEQWPPDRRCNRNRHASGSDRQLDDEAVGLARQLGGERDVLGHPRSPRMVDRSDRVVGARAANLRPAGERAMPGPSRSILRRSSRSRDGRTRD